MIAESPVMPRKPKRNDENVKIDSEVVRMARILAAGRKLQLAELLSETLRPILEKELDQFHREALKPARK